MLALVIVLAVLQCATYVALWRLRSWRRGIDAQAAHWEEEMTERLSRWDTYVRSTEEKRAAIRERFRRPTRDPSLPRDAFDADWNPGWGVVNGKWTRL